MNDKENTIATHNEKIMNAKVAPIEFKKISAQLDELIPLFNSQNNIEIVTKMKEIVPEFRSNNSIYENLDN